MGTKSGTRFPGARSPRRTAHVRVAIPVVPRVQVRTILVPVDFSPPCKVALRHAAQLAEQFASKLVLLHVVEPAGTPDFAYNPLVLPNDKVVAAAKRELGRFASGNGLGAKLIDRLLVRNGVASHEITGAARSLKADLIVMATHGYTGLKHVLLGSTTERVVRHAHCPVLVVRET